MPPTKEGRNNKGKQYAPRRFGLQAKLDRLEKQRTYYLKLRKRQSKKDRQAIRKNELYESYRKFLQEVCNIDSPELHELSKTRQNVWKYIAKHTKAIENKRKEEIRKEKRAAFEARGGRFAPQNLSKLQKELYIEYKSLTNTSFDDII